MIVYNKCIDYKSKFRDDVTRLVRKDFDPEIRVEFAGALIKAYTKAIGERPDLRELDELASWIIFGTKGVSTRKKIEIKAQEALEKREEEVADYGTCAA
ncbi:hypothetical protein [uncultured Paenibacillus sp.]|uniref:hypothetical protein n=1 Tax=uncultured Paenibacillus sp. TaxID=227322 RepID=UPI0015A7B7ED|nr:hypothetical protein [uncultured Paenibacillus sp.]DAW22617.1 MAG TPA: hypothetical protein [Caudoviricetes sp.]